MSEHCPNAARNMWLEKELKMQIYFLARRKCLMKSSKRVGLMS